MHSISLRFALSLLFVLALAMGGCKPGVPSAATQEPRTASTPIVQTDAPTQAPACPDADFETFLRRFETSADAQRAATAEVVTLESIDSDALPEPKPVSRQVPRGELEFPVMLGPSQRKAEGLEETVTEPGPSERQVKHGVPDSGMQVRFHFKASPCWTLVRISDDTI